MRWSVKCGDILNEPADLLVCSANVFLNLSGGVGGALLLRYGDAMQKELHGLLARRKLQFVQQGDVIVTLTAGLPYRAVLHAVAVDGFYRSSPQTVGAVVEKSLMLAAALGAKRVALTALATGYGRLSMTQFGKGIAPLIGREFLPVEEIVICVRNEEDKLRLATALPEC